MSLETESTLGFGLLLGGGYSWVTDQYGLAIDNTIAYDLVLPNGTYIDVTESSQPDLFFALKGGLNNFGIVTAVTVKAHPLSKIWVTLVFEALPISDSKHSGCNNNVLSRL